MALALVLIGRFLGGIGAANATLGFTYIAMAIPDEQMTPANYALSMVRIFGMAMAPALNLFLGQVNANIFSIEINPLNSIGLVLFLSNVASFIVIYFMLHEPPSDFNTTYASELANGKGESGVIWKSVFSLEILVPIMSNLSLNANFQLLETGLASASNHALDWGTI
jgi:MFS family permease